jgi:hypothetical protein
MEQRRPFAPAAAPLKAGSAQMKDCGRCQRSLPMSGFLMQIKELSASNLFYCLDVKLTEEFMDKLVLGVAALALSAGAASAQGYGYGYGYGYAAPAPATTVIIVTPPTYTAPPVAYAPGYWGGYGGGYGWGGYGRAGYWGR